MSNNTNNKITNGKLSFEITGKKRSLYRRNNNIVAADSVSDAEKRRLALRVLATNQLISPEVAARVCSYLPFKEIVKYMCATTQQRRNTLCLNARFWRFWISELTTTQLEKKLDDAGLFLFFNKDDRESFDPKSFPKVVYTICDLMLQSIDLPQMYGLFNRLYLLRKYNFDWQEAALTSCHIIQSYSKDALEPLIGENTVSNFEILFLYRCTKKQFEVILQHATKRTLEVLFYKTLFLALYNKYNNNAAEEDFGLIPNSSLHFVKNFFVPYLDFMNARGLKIREIVILMNDAKKYKLTKRLDGLQGLRMYGGLANELDHTDVDLIERLNCAYNYMYETFFSYAYSGLLTKLEIFYSFKK